MKRAYEYVKPEEVNLSSKAFERPEFNFHNGEFYVQSKVGVPVESVAAMSQFIREAMPAQHREFYEKMPFLFLSSLDEKERPWASIVVANPPFMETSSALSYQTRPISPLVTSPTTQSLHFETRLYPGDPLIENLKLPAVPFGLLGIEPHTRRRNRANGILENPIKTTDKGTVQFTFAVDQSFGNCPKYIQAREWNWKDRRQQPDYGKVERGHAALPSELESFISSSDTFYIASASKNASASLTGKAKRDKRQGLDVSHRGGKPGFVTVTKEGEQTILEYPEYIGNFMFCTLGNITTNPNVGMLFINYDNGNLLYLTGKAFLALMTPSKPGSQHTVRFELDEWVLANGVLPLEWKYISESIYNPEVKECGERSESFGVSALKLQCSGIQKECQDVFTYKFTTGVAIASVQKPGQYATFELDLGEKGKVERTWTISSPGGPNTYDICISVKTKPGGLATNWLRENMKIEKYVTLKGVEGTFTIENAIKPTTKRLVMIAGGIGITPFVSMLRGLQQKQRTVGAFLAEVNKNAATATSIQFDSIHLVYSVRSPADLAFGGELVDMARSEELGDVLHVHFYLTGSNIPSVWQGGRGRLSTSSLESLFPKSEGDKTEAMVCGPTTFMDSINHILTQELGVEASNIHTESFNY